MKTLMRVMGIDQSLSNTGVALIDFKREGNVILPHVVDHMTIKTTKLTDKKKFNFLFDDKSIDNLPFLISNYPNLSLDKLYNPFINNVKRVDYIINQLEELNKFYKPDTIVLESLAYGAKSNSRDVLSYLFYRIIESFKNQFIFVINQKTAKKLITGKGNATKEDVKKVIQATLDDINDENQFNWDEHQMDAFMFSMALFYFYILKRT